jgi:hypothetical protein
MRADFISSAPKQELAMADDETKASSAEDIIKTFTQNLLGGWTGVKEAANLKHVEGGWKRSQNTP